MYFTEFLIDWSNNNSIQFFIKYRSEGSVVRNRKIINQAVDMMTIDEVKNDISMLDNKSFSIGNASEEECRSKILKLICRQRHNMQMNHYRKKKKSKVTNYLLRANNITVTTCGKRKKDELNSRQKQQRKIKKVMENAPTYLLVNPSINNKETNDLDTMYLTCLEHGGSILNNYDWGIEGISNTEKMKRQDAYRN